MAVLKCPYCGEARHVQVSFTRYNIKNTEGWFQTGLVGVVFGIACDVAIVLRLVVAPWKCCECKRIYLRWFGFYLG